MSTRQKTRPPKPALPDFDAIVPVTRRAQIAETMRSLILSGQFEPGAQIVESELAERFGVSRGSVREAIWELVDQRLLVNKPYSGTYVAETDASTMEEVYSVRGSLEKHCFSELWDRRDGAYEDEFSRRHDSLARAVRSRDKLASIEAELHFHSFPYEFADNSVLLGVWQQLSQQIQLNFVMTQSIVHSNSFLEDARRYFEVALGPDLDAMHAEIDRHLELGVQAIRMLRPPAEADGKA